MSWWRRCGGWWTRTIEQFGGLDILVNNAGVGNRTAMADMTEKEFDWTMSVNARGPMFAIQAAVPRMRDGGRIINISSCGTHVAQVTGLLAVYQMSKGALEQLARCYMKELGARGITINSVLPGFVETELASDTPAAYKDALVKRTALGRLGTPEDIAEVVCFLASDAGRWITGEAISVSGGWARAAPCRAGVDPASGTKRPMQCAGLKPSAYAAGSAGQTKTGGAPKRSARIVFL